MHQCHYLIVTTTESLINGYVNHYLVMNMKHHKSGKKALKRLQIESKPHIAEKDEAILNEIKRIKKLQKGLYKEYEAEEETED